MSANFQPGYVILGGVLLFRMTRLSSVELELRRWPEYARVNAVASIRTGATIRSIQTLNSTCVCIPAWTVELLGKSLQHSEAQA